MPETDPYALIAQATPLPHGADQRAYLLDQAIAAADRSGSVRAQFDARIARLEEATFGGEPELAVVMFAWCRKTADERRDLIAPEELLWKYKYVLETTSLFAKISQQQIDAIAAEMATRYADSGYSLRPVYTSRAGIACNQGKIELARALWDEAMRHPRDRYADCRACEVNFEVMLCMAEQRPREALIAAEAIRSGRLGCAEIPHLTLPFVMQALHAEGHLSEALSLQAKSYRLIQSNPEFLPSISIHLDFLYGIGDLKQAALLATRHLPWAFAAKADTRRVGFYCALIRILGAARQQPDADWLPPLLNGIETGLPAPLGDTIEQRLTTAAELIHGQASTLAGALDARNDNRHYRSMLDA